MSADDIPPRIQHDLDQAHAQIDGSLERMLDVLTAQGLADLDAPTRFLGVHNALAANPCSDRDALLGTAAAAIARLLGTETDPTEGIYLP